MGILTNKTNRGQGDGDIHRQRSTIMSRKRSHTLSLTQSKLEVLYHEQQIQQQNKKKSGVLNWMKLRKKGKNLTDEPVENGVIFVDDDDDDGDHVDLEAFKKAFVEVNGDATVADTNANTQAVGEGAVDEGACVVKSVEAADKASVTRLFQDAISLPSSLISIKEKFNCGTCTDCKIEITDVELPLDGGGSVSVMTDDATAEKINAADEKTEEKGDDGGANVDVSKEGSLVKEDATAEKCIAANEKSEKEGVEEGASASASASVGISKKGSLIQDDATAETEKSSATDEESEEEGVEVDLNGFGNVKTENVKTENVKTMRCARKFGRVLSVHRKK